MNSQDQMREVTPRNKLTARISEVQRGVHSAGVIAGRGIKVTYTPNGTIVESTAESEEGASGEATTIIPRWG